MRRPRGSAGSGSVLVLALVAVAVVLAGAGAVLAQAAAAAARAATAADLAALAAADALLGRAGGDPCRAAERVAAADHASLVGCSPGADGTVVVEVSVPLEGPGAPVGPATARARAGPADAGLS